MKPVFIPCASTQGLLHVSSLTSPETLDCGEVTFDRHGGKSGYGQGGKKLGREIEKVG
jgi:hypothetical protein